MKIRKVIIPAAGLGTRFLPATKAIPKEMLPIVDKPCIQYLVEDAVASGIKEIIIITGRGKHSLEDHFDHSFELNATLKERRKTKLLKEVEKIEKMAKFYYVRQDKPLGDGHAILCAKELVKDEPFAVMFGDDIYDSKVPALKQLISKYEEVLSPVIALEKIDKKDSDKYGMVEVEKKEGMLHILKNLIEKPKQKDTPSDLAITGKYIITPELMQKLLKAKSGSKDKELRLIDGMSSYIKESPIYGYEIEGQRFDTGDKLGYLKAMIHFGLKHKELGRDFRKYLQALDL
ncbi:UTP--glucose-1-phosphate uridylyltransferase GalU [Candidatus Peregrinibacteria bacterium]|nr:UTP--glucose-1-phosphate uridylyltransferase GalU [Candidatus Peregrinibacteria bacterium]